ncbi:winged helix-turn-helix domain-containing protein, partial [Klebsiella pneumoniae]
ALEYRGISLDPASQVVEYQGQVINLPRKEFLLLHELLIQPGRVLTRDKLQQALYGWDEEVESNALEVHVHHLRKKFFPELIRTVRGVGYLVDK